MKKFVCLGLNERHFKMMTYFVKRNCLFILILNIYTVLILFLFKGNLEKYLHRNAEKFKKTGENSLELRTSGRFSCETLLKYCYQVTTVAETKHECAIVVCRFAKVWSFWRKTKLSMETWPLETFC